MSFINLIYKNLKSHHFTADFYLARTATAADTAAAALLLIFELWVEEGKGAGLGANFGRLSSGFSGSTFLV